MNQLNNNDNKKAGRHSYEQLCNWHIQHNLPGRLYFKAEHTLPKWYPLAIEQFAIEKHHVQCVNHLLSRAIPQTVRLPEGSNQHFINIQWIFHDVCVYICVCVCAKIISPLNPLESSSNPPWNPCTLQSRPFSMLTRPTKNQKQPSTFLSNGAPKSLGEFPGNLNGSQGNDQKSIDSLKKKSRFVEG